MKWDEHTPSEVRRDAVALPANHRRALHSRLAGVEQHLQAILDITEGRHRDGIFTRFDDQLPPEMAVVVQEWAADFRSELEAAKQRLGVGTTMSRVGQVLNAQLATSWVALEDSRPRNLRGYGDLSPELAQVLDDVISRLLECLATLPTRMQEAVPDRRP